MYILKYVGVAVLLFAFLVVSRMSFDDELAEQKRYCQSVAQGLHPDYLGTYGKECTK